MSGVLARRERLAAALVRLACRIAPARGWSMGTAKAVTIMGSSGNATILVLRNAAPHVEKVFEVATRAPDGVGFLVDRQGLAHRVLHVPQCLIAQLVEQRDAGGRRRRQALDQVGGEQGQRSGDEAEGDGVDVLIMRLGHHVSSGGPNGAGARRDRIVGEHPAPAPEVAES